MENLIQSRFIKYFTIPVIVLIASILFILNDIFESSGNLILDEIEIPLELKETGITENYISQLIYKSIKQINDSASIKITQMLDLETNVVDINSSPIQLKILDSNYKLGEQRDFQFGFESFQFSSKSIVKYLRKKLGKQDTYVGIYIHTDKSDTLFSLIINGQHLEINNPKRINTDDITYNCFQIAHHICNKYDPIIAILNDYHFAFNYERNLCWKESYYNFKEKKQYLVKLFDSESDRDKKWSRMLLANIYKDKGFITKDETMLSKSQNLYKQTSEFDQRLNESINNEIEDINDFLKYYCSEDHDDIILYNILRSHKQHVINSTQLIVAYAENNSVNDGYAIFYEKDSVTWQKKMHKIEINIGTQGFAPIGEKIEGDYKTPSGIFSITRAFGYNQDIETKIDFIELNDQHVWITDPNNIHYNKITTHVPTGIKHEKLKRHDHLNKYGVVIDYNMDPVVPQMGSAIFIHVERRPGYATAGCISTSESNIIRMIEWLKPESCPVIVMGSKDYLINL